MSGVNYANANTITNITEPAQELTVTSQIPNAFSYAGQTGSSVTYDLTPYAFNQVNNYLTTWGSGALAPTTNVVLTYVNPTAQMQEERDLVMDKQRTAVGVTISGYSYTSNTYSTQSVTFTNNSHC